MTEVEVTLTPEDLTALDALLRPEALTSDPSPGFASLFGALFVGLVLAAGVLAGLTQPAVAAAGFVLGLLTGGLGALALFRRPCAAGGPGAPGETAEAHRQWVFRPRRVKLTPAGVTVTGAGYRTHHDWSLICKVEPTADHLFLFTTAAEAHVVPRRAFRDARHFEDFLGYVRLCREGGAAAAGRVTGHKQLHTDIWDPESSY